MLGPGGLARWAAEAEARVREGAFGARASRQVVDLTSDRPPDPERDIVLWRDGLARTAAVRVSDARGDETEDAFEDDARSFAVECKPLARGETGVSRRETDAGSASFVFSGPGEESRARAARLAAALRRLAAPSAFAATRDVAAHSLAALDRRVAGTARRARATRDETAAAIVVSARRERARAERRARRAAARVSGAGVGAFARDFCDVDFARALSGRDARITSVPSTREAVHANRPRISDDDDTSSLSSFAAADSDDGETSVRRRDWTSREKKKRAAGDAPTRRATTFGPFSSQNGPRRTPKAPPFPTTAKETARAFLWAERRAAEASSASAEEQGGDGGEKKTDASSPRDALERFHGSAFFQAQRLDAVTRSAAGGAEGPGETRAAVDAYEYPAAAAAAVARARARREAAKKATRRENREATARARRAEAVAAEAARLARRRRALAGGTVSRRAVPVRRRNEDVPRKPGSSRARAATRAATRGPNPSARRRDANVTEADPRRRERRARLGDEDPDENAAPLPARAARVLDLAWNPHACPPDGETDATDAIPDSVDSVFADPAPKHPSLLPYTPANADACARAGDPASSRRLRAWCAYAGLAPRAEATDGHRADALRRAYRDALRAVETLAPGVAAAAAAVTAAETKRRHAEARARTGTKEDIGKRSAARRAAREKAFLAANPRDAGTPMRRERRRWKM